MFLPDFLSISFPLPPPGPDEGPVCFSFDRKWIPYILGALQALRTEGLYTSDKSNAIGAANTLLGLFTEAGICPADNSSAGTDWGDCMGCCIRMRDGILQVLQCGEWVAVDGWTKEAVTGAQPGTGTPQPPPGGCSQFSGAIEPTVSWLLPVPVSTGDVITVTNLQGSWTPSQFTDIWLCPDGNIFFAGFCADGTQAFDSGAPMPTAPLNGTILFDGTNYYDVSLAANPGTPVVVTIGSGVTNKQLLVRCNFHGGVEPAGTVTFDIQICKNASVDWTHDFDFTLSPGPFAAYHATGYTWVTVPTWVPSVGWQTGLLEDPAVTDEWRALWLQALISPASDLTAAAATWTLTKGTDTSGGATEGAEITFNPAHVDAISLTLGALSNGGNFHSGSAAGTASTNIKMYFTAGEAGAGSDPGGQVTLTHLTVQGHGVDPF